MRFVLYLFAMFTTIAAATVAGSALFREPTTAGRTDLIALPSDAPPPPSGYSSETTLKLAFALAKLGRTTEAREVLEPALDYFRARRAAGSAGTQFQLEYAEALYVSAIAQENDAAGGRVRQEALAAATSELDRLSDEARQLLAARMLHERIVAARLK